MEDTRPSRDEQRSDARPTITIQFGSRDDQQAFITEAITALKADPKTAVWRFVKMWGVGR